MNFILESSMMTMMMMNKKTGRSHPNCQPLDVLASHTLDHLGLGPLITLRCLLAAAHRHRQQATT